MKKINLILNVFIILIIVYILIFILFSIIEPVVYNKNSNGNEIKTYNDVEIIDFALAKYIDYYKEGKFEDIKDCVKGNAKKQLNKNFQTLVKKDFDSFKINSIKKFNFDVYEIDYSLKKYNSVEIISDEKIILKLHKLSKSFHVYYDSLYDLEDAGE